MNTPYKAFRDDRLLTKLEDLNTAYIHLDGVDDYGCLEITITSCEDTDDKIKATINSHGLEMDEMGYTLRITDKGKRFVVQMMK